MDAASAPEVPSDLAVEIILRLPVKSLVRFKSVCKSWRSLIESPAFISRHLKRSVSSGDGERRNADGLLIVEHHTPTLQGLRISLLSGQTLEVNTPVEVPPDPHWKVWRMVGCCNGVVCLSDERRYLLWNPATREYRALPEGPSSLSRPRADTDCDGFGYDPAADDYKIVRIASALISDKFCTRAEVFALSEGSWREIAAPSALADYLAYCCKCFSVGGFLYWAVVHVSDGHHILSFDLRDEVFRPVCYDRSLIRNKRLASSEESLCLIVDDSTANGRVLDLWVMDGGPGKETWTKRLSIGADIGIPRPLGCGLNGGILVEKISGTLAIYEAGKESLRNLPVKGFRNSLDCHFYIESLVRVSR